MIDFDHLDQQYGVFDRYHQAPIANPVLPERTELVTMQRFAS